MGLQKVLCMGIRKKTLKSTISVFVPSIGCYFPPTEKEKNQGLNSQVVWKRQGERMQKWLIHFSSKNGKLLSASVILLICYWYFSIIT